MQSSMNAGSTIMSVFIIFICPSQNPFIAHSQVCQAPNKEITVINYIIMQEQKMMKNKSVKKSSFELDDENDEETKREESSNMKQSVESSRIDDEHHDNLLDLSTQNHGHENYAKFLKDRIIVIDGPELITENVVKSYKLYKIKSRRKMEDTYETCVSRRFSDFEYLQKQLIQNYGGYIIPLLPEKNFWANINMEGEEYMNKRARDLEKYLRSILVHPVLRNSEEVQHFLFSEESKFSEEKGEFFLKMKTEQKLYSMAESAYNISKGFISRLVSKNNGKEELEAVSIMKPTLQDLKLFEYERDVGGLVKILNVLQELVENTATEMRVVNIFEENQNEKEGILPYEKLLLEFEDLCKYIVSCNEALKRRHNLRVNIDELNREYEGVEKKIKTNPRSQDVDILRNKLTRANEKCNKWTESLLGELEKSVQVGKSMIEEFIREYSKTKQHFYHS